MTAEQKARRGRNGGVATDYSPPKRLHSSEPMTPAHQPAPDLFALPPGATPADAARIYLGAGLRPVMLAGVDAAGRCTCSKGAACPKPGKHPRRAAWQATPTHASLAADARSFPGGNVGLMTGGAERLIAIDVDGAEGERDLAALEHELGALPSTLASATGGGGRHLIFVAPEWLDVASVRNTAKVLAPSVDIRANGGQVVAPPSRHASGRTYRWLTMHAPATLPDAWAERLAVLSSDASGGTERGEEDAAPPMAAPAPAPAPAPASAPRARSAARSAPRSPNRPSDDERRKLYAASALERTVAAVASAAPGARNETLNARAYSIGRIVASGWLVRQEVTRALLEAALRAGLPKSEAVATIRSGLTAGAAKPWNGRLPDDAGTRRNGGVVADYSARAESGSVEPMLPMPRSVEESLRRLQNRALEQVAPAPAPEQAPTAPRARSAPAARAREPSNLPLLRDARGGVRRCFANAVTFLKQGEWSGVLAFDSFRDLIVARRRPPSHGGEPEGAFPRPWRDADDLLVMRWLAHAHDFDASREIVTNAVVSAAHDAAFHPVRDYLSSLKWDGTPRIDAWLVTYCGAADTEVTRAVGAMWLRSAVARIREPGCKVDTMLVLEGEQGKFKSQAFNILGGAWFTDDLAELGSKDFAMQLRGAWIAEFAELDTMSRADVSRIKAVITRKVDRYRPAYGRHVIEQPRECVFAGTCNLTEYLRDETGNRRFWPVKVCERDGASIDLEGIRRDRDQLWAEAVATYEAGQRWWVTKNDALSLQLTEAQNARFETDPWQDDIAAIVRGLPWVTMSEVLAKLGLETAKREPRASGRAKRCLTHLGWTLAQRRDEQGRPVRRYYPPKATHGGAGNAEAEAEGDDHVGEVASVGEPEGGERVRIRL